MGFNRLLAHFDDGAGEKEKVALAVYHLEEFEEYDSVARSDVVDLIEASRSSISSSNLSTYLRRLRESDWITSAEQDGHQLTIFGKGRVEELLSEGCVG